MGDIHKNVHGHVIKMDRTVEALCERFRFSLMDQVILILFPEDKMQLEELINMGDRLNDVSIILVLPDREPTTISAGHKLYPRFVTFVDGDFSHVAAVLDKMLENAGCNM